MDKQFLKYHIEAMPIFVLRDVANNNNLNVEVEGIEQGSKDWQEQQKFKAVTEKGTNYPLCFVTKKYQLIQMKQVFMPIIEPIEQLEGNIVYYEGLALMTVFPEDQNLKIQDGKIGIVAVNSVNKTSSVFIKFCIEHKNKLITLPKKVAGIKKVHAGNTLDVVQNYTTVINKIKDIWHLILKEFSEVALDIDTAETILRDIKLDKDFILKKVKTKMEAEDIISFWDLFVYLMEIIEQKEYKSELHKQRYLEQISEKIIQYAIATKLIGV